MHKLQFTVTDNSNLVSLASVHITDYCRIAGFDSETRFRIQIVITEAINNIIAYASTEHPIDISCLFDEEQDELVIEIIDCGKPLTNIPDYEFPDCEAESGRGWPIIFSWMDSVSHVRQGSMNHLTMTISRS